MQAVINSLDRKVDRRRSGRSKAMCLEVVVSGESARPKLDNLSKWTCELASYELLVLTELFCMLC